MLRLELTFANIAAAVPALRPLWNKSARQNLKTRRLARQPEHNQRLKPTYVVMDQPSEADAVASRLDTCATAQGGKNQVDVGSEASPVSKRPGILEMSDFNDSSLSNRENSTEDAV